MRVEGLAKKLGMEVLSCEDSLQEEVTGVYVCDLLSWVMSHAQRGNAWITIHTNLNTIAVALLTEVSCIILPENINAEEATIKKAREEGIVVLRSPMSAYELCYKIHDLLADTPAS